MSTKKPGISIIVPVFNTQDYLPRCIDSALAQTFEDIEVILVDDGSTDHSPAICDEYAARDSRVKVIHKQNRGVSAARNAGVAAACADFILFIDSDDYIKPELCRRTYHEINKYQADLIYFMHTRVRANGKRQELKALCKDGLISEAEALRINNTIAVTAWSFLFRKHLLQALPFPEGRVCEDMAVTHHYIHMAEKIVLINDSLYDYTVGRKGSIWNSPSESLYKDGYEFAMERITDLESWGYDASYQRMLLALFILSREGLSSERGVASDRYVRTHKEIPKDFSPLQKGMLRIYRISPKLFAMICAAGRQSL